MQTLTFLFAFIAVLALIGVAAWLVRRFATNRLGTNTNRGRMPRLAVIDAAAVDGRRRLERRWRARPVRPTRRTANARAAAAPGTPLFRRRSSPPVAAADGGTPQR